MELDRNGMEVLSRPQCMELLRSSFVGRVVVSDGALPAAFPVNFALLNDDVIFRTAAGSTLEAASAGEIVAFEVDDSDPQHKAGWSVLVQGPAELVNEAEDLARVRTLELEPWATVVRTDVIRIRSELVSGRRLIGNQAFDADQPVKARDAGQLETLVSAWRPPCPNCGSWEFMAVTAGGRRNFVCVTCAACWHVEGARLGRVDPLRCSGCAFKPACTAAAARHMLASAPRPVLSSQHPAPSVQKPAA